MANEKKKSDLAPRLVTAGVAIPILLYLIFAAPAWAFGLLVLWAVTTSVWEYCNITYGEKHRPGVWFVSAVGAALFGVQYWLPAHFGSALITAALLVFIFFLFRYREQSDASHQIGSSIAALIYGVVMFGTIGLLHKESGPAGPLWVLFLLCIIWLSDTGAYFSGRALGKHKLYQAVSPGKSIEGAVGGFLSSIAAGIGLNAAYPALLDSSDFLTETLGLQWTPLTLTQVLIVVIPAFLLGVCGDLSVSLIKRAHGVKDSGTIIYGHGGMLDRIDALIFAAPWVYICFSNFL